VQRQPFGQFALVPRRTGGRHWHVLTLGADTADLSRHGFLQPWHRCRLTHGAASEVVLAGLAPVA